MTLEPPTTTVFEALAHSATRWPSRPMLCTLPETADIYRVEAGEIDYREMLARVSALSKAYAGAGYGHGHRVGLALENRPAFFEHWFALNALGASVVPINADLRSAELEYLVGHAEIVLAVGPGERHAALRDAAAAAGRTLRLAVPGDHPPSPACPPPAAGRQPDAGTECALLYTSGTTGRPKGCMLPNRYFLLAGQWYATIGGLASLEPGAERMLTPLPLVHMNAMAYSTMAMLMTGGCLVPLDRFHPGTWWDSVRASGATVVHYLGVMPAMLMKAPAGEADRSHRVRFGFGAGVDGRLHDEFESRFGFPLLEAWAMTETGAGAVIIANREPRKTGTACFGRERPEVEVRIVGDDGSEAPVGSPGELRVRRRGPDPRDGFFAGYLKDAEATAEAWAGGWFHTGDVVVRDADGDLHFVDRRKNVIRRSGENISAVEVEAVLQRHPALKAAAVAAVPDPVRGDEVMALVVADPAPAGPEEARRLAAALVRWCLERLAYYKAPGRVAFVDALPLTSTNKVQRAELKALALRLCADGASEDTRAMKRRGDAGDAG